MIQFSLLGSDIFRTKLISISVPQSQYFQNLGERPVTRTRVGVRGRESQRPAGVLPVALSEGDPVHPVGSRPASAGTRAGIGAAASL